MATKINKNIVLLIRNAAPNDFGGAETYPVSLAKILETQEWVPIIVSGSRKLLDYSERNNIKYIKGKWLTQQNWTGRRMLFLPIFIVWQVYLTFWYIALIKKTRARTIHIQSRDDFIAGSIAGRILHRKVIWTDHMDLRYIFENITKPLRNPVGKLVFWAAHFTDHIILISDNEHRLVTNHFKKKTDLKDKIVIVKNGVTDHFEEMHAGTPNDTFVYSLVSRVVRNKGIGEAIEAFNLLQEDPRFNNTRLHIYGDGKDLSFFKNKAKDNASIVFFGHTEHSLEAIHDSDVYILPSYQEGFSIALLEATMLGKAIIATNVDSNSEIVENGKTGLLVPAHDPRTLANSMRTLHQNPDLIKKYGSSTRKRYIKDFNLETKVKKEILPLYQ